MFAKRKSEQRERESGRSALGVRGQQIVLVVAGVKRGGPSIIITAITVIARPTFETAEGVNKAQGPLPLPRCKQVFGAAWTEPACLVHPWRTSMPKTIGGGGSTSDRLPHRHCRGRYLLPPVPTPEEEKEEAEEGGTDLGGPSMSG